ncbi:unnamed protein product [Lepidochelys olivacea]
MSARLARVSYGVQATKGDNTAILNNSQRRHPKIKELGKFPGLSFTPPPPFPGARPVGVGSDGIFCNSSSQLCYNFMCHLDENRSNAPNVKAIILASDQKL